MAQAERIAMSPEARKRLKIASAGLLVVCGALTAFGAYVASLVPPLKTEQPSAPTQHSPEQSSSSSTFLKNQSAMLVDTNGNRSQRTPGPGVTADYYETTTQLLEIAFDPQLDFYPLPPQHRWKSGLPLLERVKKHETESEAQGIGGELFAFIGENVSSFDAWVGLAGIYAKHGKADYAQRALYLGWYFSPGRQEAAKIILMCGSGSARAPSIKALITQTPALAAACSAIHPFLGQRGEPEAGIAEAQEEASPAIKPNP